MEHQIIVVGIGPGHPDYLLPAARKALADAQVLIGGRRALAAYAKEGQETAAITADLQGLLIFIRQQRCKADVTIMVSGDPGYFSLLDLLHREFPPEVLRVIPGISSFQLAFARLALPWQDARLLSLHGRKPKEQDWCFQPGTKLGVLTDAVYHSQAVAKFLLERGWPEDAFFAVCSRLSYADEMIWTGTIQEAADRSAVSHCILVVCA